MTQLEIKLQKLNKEIASIDINNAKDKKTILRWFRLRRQSRKIWDKIHGISTIDKYLQNN